MSDLVLDLKRELLAAAERRQEHAVPDMKRRRRLREDLAVPEGRRRRRTIALAAAVLVVIIGTASAIGSVRDFILDRGFVGLPPRGATPSAPESGELVVRSFSIASPSPRQHSDLVSTWVYADGRVIWERRPFHARGGIPQGANEFTSGYLERRLSPEGVALVRAAVAELFDRSRPLVASTPADEELWTGICNVRLALLVANSSLGGIVGVPDGDQQARLHVLRDRHEQPCVEGTAATPEQLSALRRVHALLTEPASVLPPSAWVEQKVRAYVPSHYAVCVETSPPLDAFELLSLLPAGVAEQLRGASRTRREGEMVGARVPDAPIGVLGQSVTDCYRLATEEARGVAATLSGSESATGGSTGGTWLAYRVAKGINWWEETTIFFEPYLPDGQIPNSRPAG